MLNQFDLLIDGYLNNNIGIDKLFLTEALSKGLEENILQLQKDNLMTAAGIGNATVADGNQKMRTDKIYWLDKTHDIFMSSNFYY